MRSESRESIKNEIEQRILKTKTNIENLRKTIKPIPLDGSIGRVTRMDAIQHRSISEANLREAENSLSLLEHALSNIDQENFGECVKCKKQIQIERILAIPEARLCVSCASERD